MPYSKNGPQKKIFSGTQKYFLTTKKKNITKSRNFFWDKKKVGTKKKKFLLQVGQKNFLDRENFFGFFSLGDQKKSWDFFSWQDPHCSLSNNCIAHVVDDRHINKHIYKQTSLHWLVSITSIFPCTSLHGPPRNSRPCTPLSFSLSLSLSTSPHLLVSIIVTSRTLRCKTNHTIIKHILMTQHRKTWFSLR